MTTEGSSPLVGGSGMFHSYILKICTRHQPQFGRTCSPNYYSITTQLLQHMSLTGRADGWIGPESRKFAEPSVTTTSQEPPRVTNADGTNEVFFKQQSC